MLTDNFRQLYNLSLQSYGSGGGLVPVTTIAGLLQYAAPVFAFPMASRTVGVTLNASEAGISLGTGGTPATEYDRNLESTITSGINTIITKQYTGLEEGTGAPFLRTNITVVNKLTAPVTIREVGYKQSVTVAPYAGSTARYNALCLIDRTVLDTPMTIYPDDVGVVVYTLKTALPEPKIVNGIKMVSWEWGSDEDITAMIEAAHEGLIDLQEDAGWMIGMKRPIKISAFTGGGNVSHAEQTIDLVITSFDDYNNCGCVMQVDFDEALATGQRMNATDTNVDGYGGSEMRTTTIPALVEALPEYIQDMLITFSVKTSAGNRSSTIVETTGNKLALRSVLELKGTNTASYAGEGDGRIPFYALYNDSKRRGRAGSTNYFWTRSPRLGGSDGFCYLNGDGGVSNSIATYVYGLAPFGCM